MSTSLPTLLAGALLIAGPAATEAPAPPESTVRSEAYNAVAVQQLRQLDWSRGPRREALTVRHVLFVSVALSETRPAAEAAANAAPHRCRWKMSLYLQRQICFASQTGLTGCAEPATLQQPEAETGDLEFQPADPNAPKCDEQHPLFAAAKARLDGLIAAEGARRIDADLRSEVLPGLSLAGAKVRVSAPASP